MTEPAQLLSLADLAALFGVSDRRARQLRARAKVGRRIGGVWVLTEQEAWECQPRKTGRPKRTDSRPG